MRAFWRLRKSVENAREAFYPHRAEQEFTVEEASKAQSFV
jgi:hypothetical protein